MKIRLIGLLLACLVPGSSAFAQATPSRLDEVIKSAQLRVCTPGDYKPFSFHRPDGNYEGLDIDLVQAAAKALGVQVQMVKSAWPTLMKDFLEKCDVAVGGISVSTDSVTMRGKSGRIASIIAAVNASARATRCSDVHDSSNSSQGPIP